MSPRHDAENGGASRSDGSPMPAQRCPLPQDTPAGFIGQFARSLENLSEHLFGQLARLRVLIRGVIGGQEDASIGQRVFGAVAEFILRACSAISSRRIKELR